jgi:Nucleotidyl transferase AbiEii toxin, Type IV TA system
VAAFIMAKDKPGNTSASIRQRLLNHSTAIKTDPNLVLIWYGLERFLYRLSVSTHSERFVLKGAMLFRLWGGASFRSTKDLDLEGFLQDEAEVVREVFASICVQPVEDDGLVFDASSATPGLGVVIDRISEFVLPPAIAAATELPFNQHWEVQTRWQPVR